MIKTAILFTDDMVLQRDKRIAIFGEADGDYEITVTLGGNSVSVKAAEGKWCAELPPMPAGGPYELHVAGQGENLCYKNVMIGEVWFAGGQSNMELELVNSLNGKEIEAAIVDSPVRYFFTPHVGFFGEEMDKADATNKWHVCAPKQTAGCSAVAYYFALNIAKELGVCVGIINCSWGGTSASCWMDEATINAKASTKIYMDEYNQAIEGKSLEEYLKEKAEYEVYYEQWNKKVEEYYSTQGDEATWEGACAYAGENRWPGPVGPQNEYRPTGLYHAMVQRLCPYTLRGFLYYQGEQDESKPDIYFELLQSLVQKWRLDWGDDTLPFLLVQLPMFKNKGDKDLKNWPLIREAQMRVFQTVKNTGIAVILDCGEFNNIHPVDKKPVGERLALQALYEIYQKKADAFGPIYKDYQIEGKRMKLHFLYAENGMVYKKDEACGIEPEQSETAFEIAGEDKKYYPAKIKVEKDTVTAWADEVSHPCYVRYAWTNYGPVTMFGVNGLPMAPFRTSVHDVCET